MECARARQHSLAPHWSLDRILASDWSVAALECLHQEIPAPLATLSCVTDAVERRCEGHAPGFCVLLILSSLCCDSVVSVMDGLLVTLNVRIM